jgi:hypothetical protein
VEPLTDSFFKCLPIFKTLFSGYHAISKINNKQEVKTNTSKKKEEKKTICAIDRC